MSQKDRAAFQVVAPDFEGRSKPHTFAAHTRILSLVSHNGTFPFVCQFVTGRRTLALLDTITRQVSIPRLPAGSTILSLYRSITDPVWSPDGRRLLVAANYRPDEPYNDVLLVDLEQEAAYKIGEANFPVGWLVLKENEE